MSYLHRLSLGFSRKLIPIRQTEASECGLACLAMVAYYYGYESDLFTLRRKYSISQKGATLATLVKIATNLNLSNRALKLEVDEIDKLRLPCILHWDLNHFVVLKSVSQKNIVILDPSFGERKLSLSSFSSHFTGIAVELWPNSSFEEKKEKRRIKTSRLFGEVHGLWKSFGQIIIFAFSLEILALVNPFFMQWVIDHAILSADLNLLATLAIGFGLLMLTSNFINLLQSWAVMYMATTLNLQWKTNIVHHLLHLPTSFFQKRHLGDIVSRFSSIDTIQKTLTTSFITAILDGILTVFTLFLMFIYSAKLACISIVTVSIYIFIRWAWYGPLRRSSENEIIYAAKQNTYFMESMRGIKTIKQFGKQEYRKSTWSALFVDQINSNLMTQKLTLVFSFTNGVLFGLENIITIWLGATLVISGNFTVGVFMAFIAYKTQFGTRVSSLVDKYVELKMLNLHGERLADIVLSDQEQDNNLVIQSKQTEDGYKTNIEVKSLKFKYSAEEHWLIQGMNFSIPAGQSVAIVGATGCGKTTLMNLLLGNLNYDHGYIKLGGRNLRDIGKSQLNQIVASVSQDDVLFAGSIQENISFFDHDSQQDWIEKCAKMAGIHNEILSMPMAYQTLVGDMGNILSGGQKQRILLARALYKRPKIIFLDEATSHLDIIKEKEINSMIKSLDITRIIIAHRPETIASVDRILVIDGGRIINDQETSNLNNTL